MSEISKRRGDGSVEGRGGGSEKTANRKWKDYLSLARIQAAPITVMPLCAGYATVTQTILDPVVAGLVGVGVAGHAGIFIQNEVFDKEYDERAGKTDRPLVNGRVDRNTALTVSTVLIVLSALIASSLNLVFGAVYGFSVVLGMFYNYQSKEDEFSPLYLGVWGFITVIAGSVITGDANTWTLLFALIYGVHMIWQTVIANIKDAREPETNLLDRFECKIVDEGWGDVLKITPAYTNYITLPLISSQLTLGFIGVLYGIVEWFVSGGDATTVAISAVGMVVLIHPLITTSLSIGRTTPFDEDEVKTKILKNEILYVSMFLLILINAIGFWTAAIMFFGSVAWPIIMLTILYGSPTNIP